MVDIAQSSYTVLKSTRDYLRTNLSATVVAINAESSVDGHASPDPEDADIMVGRLRVPPQNEQWVLLFESSEFERLGLAVGVSSTTFRVHVVSGLRSQTFRTDAGAGITIARTTEDAGTLRSHLLARACHDVVQKHLFSLDGVRQVKYVGGNSSPPKRNEPDVYEFESRYDVMLRTRNSAFTT